MFPISNAIVHVSPTPHLQPQESLAGRIHGYNQALEDPGTQLFTMWCSQAIQTFQGEELHLQNLQMKSELG